MTGGVLWIFTLYQPTQWNMDSSYKARGQVWGEKELTTPPPSAVAQDDTSVAWCSPKLVVVIVVVVVVTGLRSRLFDVFPNLTFSLTLEWSMGLRERREVFSFFFDNDFHLLWRLKTNQKELWPNKRKFIVDKTKNWEIVESVGYDFNVYLF